MEKPAPLKGLKSCKPCRNRKIRCDRGMPCVQCVSRGDTCDWAGATPAIADSPPSAVAELSDKLKAQVDSLERILWRAKQTRRRGVKEESEEEEVTAESGPARKRARRTPSSAPSEEDEDQQARIQALEARLARFERLSTSLATPDGTISSPSTGSVALYRPQQHSDAVRSLLVGFSELNNRLALSILPGALSLHLLGEFFAVHGYAGLQISPSLVVGSSFDHEGRMRGEHVDPMTEALVAALIAKCATLTDHSSVLGADFFTAGAPPPADIDLPPDIDYSSAGEARLPVVNALRERAFKACDLAGAHRTASLESIRLLTFLAHLAKRNNSPEGARSYIRSAVDHLKTLLDADTTPFAVRRQLEDVSACTIFEADSTLSARFSKAPYIAEEDLETYFRFVGGGALTRDPTLDTQSAARSIRAGTFIEADQGVREVWFHVLKMMRRFGKEVSSRRARQQPLYTEGFLRINFEAIDRSSVFLVSVEQELRQIPELTQGSLSLLLLLTDTRRLLVDLEFLLYRAVVECYALYIDIVNPSEALQLGAVYRESRARARRAVRTTIAIFQILRRFSNSTNDLLYIYGQAVSLSRVPDWTDLVLLRHGEDGGPETKEEEVTEQELERLMQAFRRSGWTYKHARKWLGIIQQGLDSIRRKAALHQGLSMSPSLATQTLFSNSTFDPNSFHAFGSDYPSPESLNWDLGMPVAGQVGPVFDLSAFDAISPFDDFTHRFNFEFAGFPVSSSLTAYEPAGHAPATAPSPPPFDVVSQGDWSMKSPKLHRSKFTTVDPPASSFFIDRHPPLRPERANRPVMEELRPESFERASMLHQQGSWLTSR